MNFQEANNLGPDGVVGENTYNKMFSSEAKRYIAPTPTPTNKPIQRSGDYVKHYIVFTMESK